MAASHVLIATWKNLFHGAPRHPYSAVDRLLCRRFQVTCNKTNVTNSKDAESRTSEQILSREQSFSRFRRVYYQGRTFSEAWNRVWDSKETPFDLGRPNPVLEDALRRKNMVFKQILVPGFGSGHDLITLAKCNPNCVVTALEIASMALVEAEKVISEAYKNRELTESCIDLTLGDFFADHGWETVYDFKPEAYGELSRKEDKELEQTDHSTAKADDSLLPSNNRQRTSPEASSELLKISEREPAINTDDVEGLASNEQLKKLLSSMTGGAKEKGHQENDESPDDQIGFDCLYDHGFFSALPTRLRIRYAERVAEMLTPGTGRLLTIMYPIDETGCTDPLDGPPFCSTIEDCKSLLAPAGLEMEGEPYESPESLPDRRGKEFICWWKRGESVPNEEPKPKPKMYDWAESDNDSDSD